MDKQRLRNLIKTLRRDYPVDLRQFHAGRVVATLWELVRENGFQTIHCFIPLPEEIDVFPFLLRALAAQKKVIVPRTLTGRMLEHLVFTDPRSLVTGRFGTRYPENAAIYSGTYDLIVVPGLAFDTAGNRLGYGAGYYDAFLRENPQALKVGIGFPFQVLPEIPTEPHDVTLDRVIS